MKMSPFTDSRIICHPSRVDEGSPELRYVDDAAARMLWVKPMGHVSRRHRHNWRRPSGYEDVAELRWVSNSGTGVINE